MPDKLKRQFDSESKRLFRDMVLMVWAVVTFYTLFYCVTGMYFAALTVALGVFVLSPLILQLERTGHGTLARYLFLVSANYYIFASSLAMNHQVHVEYYAVPAVMVGLLIGDWQDLKFILLATVLPILSWSFSGGVVNLILPPELQHNVPFAPMLSHLNFFGAFCLSLTFLAIFMRAMRAQRAQMINAAKMSSLGEMAGGIAHEINNPLAIIAAKAGLMKLRLTREEVDVEVLKRDLSKIEDTANRIGRITHGLRTFSRSAEQDPMTKESIKSIFDDTIELCCERFKNKNVGLTVVVPEDLHAECRPIQLSQVFMNLLGNGLDAVEGSENAWVRVEVEHHANKMRLRFVDSGLGIEPAVLEKIMTPFFTTKEAGRGTGLGLSISSAIIEEHGGRIYYDTSSPNTCFVVELPEVLGEAA